MTNSPLKRWTQIDVANYFDSYKNGKLTEYKQNIKRSNKFQGKKLLKLNKSGIKLLIKKELKIDDDSDDFNEIFNCIQSMIQDNKISSKKKIQKKRHKSVTKNSRKKKQNVSTKSGHDLFSLKLTKSTSYSPTAKKPKSDNTGASTPNISIDTTVYNDNNPDNRHLEDDNKKLNDQILKLECNNKQLKDENDILRNDFNEMKSNNNQLKLKVDLLNEQVLNLTKKQVILNEKLKVKHSDTINWIMSLDESDVKKYKAIMEYKHRLIKHGNKNTNGINSNNINKINPDNMNSINTNNYEFKIDIRNDHNISGISEINENKLDDSKIDTDIDSNISADNTLSVDDSLLKLNPDSYSSTNTIIDNNDNNIIISSTNHTNTSTNNDNISNTNQESSKKKYGPPKFWDIPDLSKSKRERAAIGSCISKR